MVQLKDALNTVWEVEEQPGHGVWRFIRSYVVPLAAVLALGFLLLVSLVVTAGLAAIGKFAAPYMQEWVLHLLSILVSLSVISLLFAMMFKWLPDAEVNWYDVWLGAVITAVFFEIGKAAIGFYIGKQGLEFDLRCRRLDHRCINLGVLHHPRSFSWVLRSPEHLPSTEARSRGEMPIGRQPLLTPPREHINTEVNLAHCAFLRRGAYAGFRLQYSMWKARLSVQQNLLSLQKSMADFGVGVPYELLQLFSGLDGIKPFSG